MQPMVFISFGQATAVFSWVPFFDKHVAAQAANCSRRGAGGRPTVDSCVHSATAAARAAA